MKKFAIMISMLILTGCATQNNYVTDDKYLPDEAKKRQEANPLMEDFKRSGQHIRNSLARSKGQSYIPPLKVMPINAQDVYHP